MTPTTPKRWAAVMLLLVLAFIATLPSEPVDVHRPARPLPFSLDLPECAP